MGPSERNYYKRDRAGIRSRKEIRAFWSTFLALIFARTDDRKLLRTEVTPELRFALVLSNRFNRHDSAGVPFKIYLNFLFFFVKLTQCWAAFLAASTLKNVIWGWLFLLIWYSSICLTVWKAPLIVLMWVALLWTCPMTNSSALSKFK